MQSSIICRAGHMLCASNRFAMSAILSNTSRKKFSTDFAQEEYRRMQAAIAGSGDHQKLGVYNELEVRNWLSTFTGGKISLERDSTDGIAVLTIEHAEKKNAMTGTMMIDLSESIQRLEQWTDGRVVILRGANGDFCSGGDLTNFMSRIADPLSGIKMCLFMQNLTSRLAQLPAISVALIEGNALGGGAELTMCCDFRLMTSDARLAFIQTKLGITTGWGGATMLARRTGYQNALRTVTSGAAYTAEDAVRFQLVDGVLKSSGDKPLDQAKAWLKKHVFQGTAESTRAYKAILSNAYAVNITESLRKERECFGSLWGGPGHLAAIKKILDQQQSPK